MNKIVMSYKERFYVDRQQDINQLAAFKNKSGVEQNCKSRHPIPRTAPSLKFFTSPTHSLFEEKKGCTKIQNKWINISIPLLACLICFLMEADGLDCGCLISTRQVVSMLLVKDNTSLNSMSTAVYIKPVHSTDMPLRFDVFWSPISFSHFIISHSSVLEKKKINTFAIYFIFSIKGAKVEQCIEEI